MFKIIADKLVKLILIILGVMVIKITLVPLINEYSSKETEGPLYVKKIYEMNECEEIEELISIKGDIPEEYEEKYFLSDMYIHPKVCAKIYGNQEKKSAGSPYEFIIVANSGKKGEEVTISNLVVEEINLFSLTNIIYKMEDEIRLSPKTLDNTRYSEGKKYTDDLKVSKIYVKPLIITFDVSMKVNGQTVTKSMEYRMEPKIERGINWPSIFNKRKKDNELT